MAHIVRQGQGGTDVVGHHRKISVICQRQGNLFGSGAKTQQQAGTGRDQLGNGSTNTGLGLQVGNAARLKRRIALDHVQLGAAMTTTHQIGLIQVVQVAPYRLGRHPEMRGQAINGHRPLGGEQIHNNALPDG